jgi:hypothetical protein
VEESAACCLYCLEGLQFGVSVCYCLIDQRVRFSPERRCTVRSSMSSWLWHCDGTSSFFFALIPFHCKTGSGIKDRTWSGPRTIVYIIPPPPMAHTATLWTWSNKRHWRLRGPSPTSGEPGPTLGRGRGVGPF